MCECVCLVYICVSVFPEVINILLWHIRELFHSDSEYGLGRTPRVIVGSWLAGLIG